MGNLIIIRKLTVGALTAVSLVPIPDIEFRGMGCCVAFGSFRSGCSTLVSISAVGNHLAGQLCVSDKR